MSAGEAVVKTQSKLLRDLVCCFMLPSILSCCLHPVLLLPLSAQLTLDTGSFKHRLMCDLAIEEQQDLLTPAVFQ